jgi:predicted Zn-dependent protease
LIRRLFFDKLSYKANAMNADLLDKNNESFLDRLSRRGWLWAAILAFVIYLPALRYDFVGDDLSIVRGNPSIRHLTRPSEYLATPWWSNNTDNANNALKLTQYALYRPLTMASFAVNYALGGLTPWGYHLVNNLMHALNAALVWWLAWMVAGWNRDQATKRRAAVAATAAALLFAVHAVHVEAVAQIVGRAELMMTAGYLAALIAAQWSRQAPDARGRWLRALAVLPATFFASASKEHGVTLPAAVALLALDIFWTRPTFATSSSPACVDKAAPGRHRNALSTSSSPLALALWRTAPSLAMATVGVLLYLAARLAVLGIGGGGPDTTNLLMENPLCALSGFKRRWAALAVLARMGGLLALPVNPSPLYSAAVFTPGGLARDPLSWVGLALIVATAAAAWAWRRRPLALLGLAWLPVTLALSSNMLVPIGTILGERLLYLPSVMTSLAIGYFAVAATRRWARVVMAALLGAWCFGLLALHARYLPQWRDNDALTVYVIHRVPECAMAQFSYAGLCVTRMQLEEALQHLEIACRLAPEIYLFTGARAVVMARLGRPGALEALEKTQAAHPDLDAVDIMLSRLLLKQGKNKQAEKVLRDRVHYNPAIVEAWQSLADFLEGQGRLAEAEDACVKCRDDNPDNVDALVLLAMIHAKTGHDLDDALRAANHALELQPNKTSALEAQGWVLERQGKAQEAIVPLKKVAVTYGGAPAGTETYVRLIDAYLKCSNLKSEDVAMLNDLANYLADEGRDLDLALIAAKRALALLPKTPQISDTVGLVLARQGKPKEAIPFFEKAAAAYRDNPDGADVYMHLADAYAKAGRAADARLTSETAKALAARLSDAGQAGWRAQAAQPAAAPKDLSPGAKAPMLNQAPTSRPGDGKRVLGRQ